MIRVLLLELKDAITGKSHYAQLTHKELQPSNDFTLQNILRFLCDERMKVNLIYLFIFQIWGKVMN